MLSNIVGILGIAMIVFIVMAFRAYKKKTGNMKKWILYALGCFVIAGTLGNFIPSPKQDNPAPATPATPASSSVSNTSTTDENTADNAKTKDAKQSQSEPKKTSTDKATQQAELAALGDWSIKSNSDDFANRYTKIQKYIAAGDRQSAYDEATMASKRADDLNSKTMNNQDMANVPKDIPSDVRDVLNGVDNLLATGYMSEKDGFDKLADAINTNDLSKLNEAKDDFAVANDQFNQAKALIDKANGMLK
jgi:hypothetical protein